MNREEEILRRIHPLIFTVILLLTTHPSTIITLAYIERDIH
jgi:hypothetical protein